MRSTASGSAPGTTRPRRRTPRRWLSQQFDRYEARPEPIAAAPQRAQVAGQLADYFEEVRSESQARRRAGQALGPPRRRPPACQPRRRWRADMARKPAGHGRANDPTAGLPDSARRFIRQTSRQNYLALVQARTNAALTTPAPFVERMVHFWANHFAVSADKLR